MKKGYDFISVFLIVVVLLLFIGMALCVVIPTMILVTPFLSYSDKKRQAAFRKFVLQIGDKNFFCYNNRSDAKEFIEQKIIPNLPKEIEIIYLNGRELQSDYDETFVSMLLYSFKEYKKFPHLLKIRNGQIIDLSINNRTFNCINQGKPIENMFDEINSFFEVTSNLPLGPARARL